MNYNQLATDEVVIKTATALQTNGIEPVVVHNGAEALAKIKELIPAGASVNNGASKTLEQIGFIDYLKNGQHGWNNLKAAILIETDPVKKSSLRKQAALADYYLGSVHGLAENGEFIIASNTSSQLAPIVFTFANLIFVVSTKKIVPTLADAMERMEKIVFPLEDKSIFERTKTHTQISKVVIFKKENSRSGRKVRMILVNEDLGY